MQTRDEPAHRQQLLSAVNNCIEPVSGRSLGSLQAVSGFELSGEQAELTLQLPFAVKTREASLLHVLESKLRDNLQGRKLSLSLTIEIAATAAQGNAQSIPGVKNIIAIASGKGGVGKSATAANLALALQQEGARVGVLDADIYGPSQPLMLGVAEGTRPQVVDEKYFLPVPALGLQTMSMGYMVTEKTPMVWRGPMVSGALMQMIQQTRWDSLDYLLIDMPPGTGDIQLTLAQQIPCTGSVVVTTPQNIALLDARKGVEMFNKVGIPCFGIIENMATHICSACGHEDAIFGTAGGEKIAAEYAVPLLGSLPLDAKIREGLDVGRPTVSEEPKSSIAESFRAIARRLSVQVYAAARNAAGSAPEIIISDD